MGKNIAHLYRIDIKFFKHKPAEKELLLIVLGSRGIPTEEIIQETGVKGEKLYFYVKTKRKCNLVLSKFRKLKLKHVRIKSSALANKDWQDKWKKYYKPFKINKNITIVPHGMSQNKKWDEKTIFLDVGMAFGSGMHSTTKFMSELIELKLGEFNSFFDVGTGTGILTMIASRFGVQDLWAIDIDVESIINAKKNFILNKVHVGLIEKVDLKKFKEKKKFDFIAANLRTDVLIGMRRKILSYVKNGKYLAVSGVSMPNYKSFRKNFDGRDIKCLRIKKDKQWCALLYKKISMHDGQENDKICGKIDENKIGSIL